MIQKIHIQSIVFLNTRNNQLEEIIKRDPVHNRNKLHAVSRNTFNVKYVLPVRRKSTKQTNKNCGELWEGLTKWKQEPCSFWKQEYILKKYCLLRLISRFDKFPIKIMGYF